MTALSESERQLLDDIALDVTIEKVGSPGDGKDSKTQYRATYNMAREFLYKMRAWGVEEEAMKSFLETKWEEKDEDTDEKLISIVCFDGQLLNDDKEWSRTGDMEFNIVVRADANGFRMIHERAYELQTELKSL